VSPGMIAAPRTPVSSARLDSSQTMAEALAISPATGLAQLGAVGEDAPTAEEEVRVVATLCFVFATRSCCTLCSALRALRC
jgi:hypothetical protein